MIYQHSRLLVYNISFNGGVQLVFIVSRSYRQ